MGKKNGKLGMIMHCQIEKIKIKSSRYIRSINGPQILQFSMPWGSPKCV
jgi:hypothetical protein